MSFFKKNYSKMLNKSFYYLGVFICFYSFRYKNLSLVFLPLVMILFVDILKFKIYKNYTYEYMLLFYYLLIMISASAGLIYSYKLFCNNFFSFGMIRILIFIAILILNKISNNNIKNLFSGLKIGIFINYIWGTFEIIFWKFYNFPLNHYIFYEILKIDVDHTWLNLRNGNIRICGISWDPLTIGMLSVIGFFIYKSKYLKFYSLIILYLSGSRNSMLACALTYLFIYIYNLLKKNKKIGILLMICSLLGCLTLTIYFSKYKVYKEYGNSRRKQYYFSAIKSTYINKNPILFFFGGSPIYTGRIFIENKELSQKTYLQGDMYNKYWKIESDWAGILAGRGWIGLISYIFLFFFSFYIASDILLKKIIILFFFLGIGYCYETSLLINIILIYVNQNYRLKIKRRSTMNCQANFKK